MRYLHPRLLLLASIVLFYLGISYGQSKTDEALSPLTDEERSLNARDLILNQPDFVADLSFFVGEGFGGFGGAERLARKGNRYRIESQF